MLSIYRIESFKPSCMKEIMNAEELLSLPYLQPNITTPVLMVNECISYNRD